jgi:hypothetical protein
MSQRSLLRLKKNETIHTPESGIKFGGLEELRDSRASPLFYVLRDKACRGRVEVPENCSQVANLLGAEGQEL